MTRRKPATRVPLRAPEKVTPADPDYRPQTRQEAIRQVMAATIREIHTTEEDKVSRLASQPANSPGVPAGQPATLLRSQPANASHSQPANSPDSYRARGLVKVSVRMREEIVNKINDFCYAQKIEKQAFFEALAGWFFEEPAGQPAQHPTQFLAGQPTHDDGMKIFTTKEDIIMCYQRYTGRAWTYRDDEIGRRFNEVDIRLIEGAIILTIANKLGGTSAYQRIKSFKYFVGEIEYIIDSLQRGVFQDVGGYHAYALDIWGRRIKPLRDQKWKIK